VRGLTAASSWTIREQSYGASRHSSRNDIPVTALRLRPMTSAEFNIWRARILPGYAAAHVRAGVWSAGEADSRAAKLIGNLLPVGVETPGMLLLSAETPDGSSVGMVWLVLDRPRPGAVWIHNIEIFSDHRGKGYGRELLEAAEQHSMKHGAEEIGLNVFGGNTVASSLYESSGYEISSLQMRKRLAGTASTERSANE
jgi:ribosomal protein S18 acetylase RimI-like enzyme